MSQWGLSDAVGPILVGDTEHEVFLGRELGSRREVSEKTAQLVDAEVSRVINEAYSRARAVLTEHKDLLYAMATNLLERETLTRDDFAILRTGGTLPPRPPEPGSVPQVPPAAPVPSATPRPVPPPLLGGPEPSPA